MQPGVRLLCGEFMAMILVVVYVVRSRCCSCWVNDARRRISRAASGVLQYCDRRLSGGLLVELLLVGGTWAIGTAYRGHHTPIRRGTITNTEALGIVLYTRYVYLSGGRLTADRNDRRHLAHAAATRGVKRAKHSAGRAHARDPIEVRKCGRGRALRWRSRSVKIWRRCDDRPARHPAFFSPQERHIILCRSSSLCSRSTSTRAFSAFSVISRQVLRCWC